MKFRTRAAGTRFSHHPEIILFPPGYHMNRGVEASGFENCRPDRMCFLIKLSRITIFWLINGGIEFEGGTSKHPLEFPSPFNCILFEIIAERPITKHLRKKCDDRYPSPHLLGHCVFLLPGCTFGYQQLS